MQGKGAGLLQRADSAGHQQQRVYHCAGGGGQLDGSFPTRPSSDLWSVPSTINSTQCKVKVLGNYNGQTALDTSTSVFTISPAAVGNLTVLSPHDPPPISGVCHRRLTRRNAR